MPKIEIDVRGKQCPIPVVEATRALRAMREPGTLEIRVDNDIAVQNLTRMAAGNRLTSEYARLGERDFAVTIHVPAPIGDGPLEEPECRDCAPAAAGGPFVVAVGTDAMGRSSQELGRTLMKGFLFAVTQLPRLPDTILFYNGGASLTVEGSDSLEDLKGLEERGVEILTCGTCLNFYGLTERLAVGGVTNMYTIVEKLAGAGRVVRP